MIKKLTILFVVLALLLFARLWFGNGSLPEIWLMQDQLSQLTVENEAMQARNNKLEAEIEGLKESLDAIEARARNDFGMIKRGESFYQIVLKKKTQKKQQVRVDTPATPSQNVEHNEQNKR